MIALGVLHQTLHKVEGYSVFHNVTKFQNCKSNNKFRIGETPLRKIFDKNNMTYRNMFLHSIPIH